MINDLKLATDSIVAFLWVTLYFICKFYDNRYLCLAMCSSSNHSHSNCQKYFRGCDAVVFVYDITDKVSFENIGKPFHFIDGQIDK